MLYLQNELHAKQEENSLIISQFNLCKKCHCQSCFHEHLDQKRNVKSGKNDRDKEKSQVIKQVPQTRHTRRDTQHPNWSENWFQDIARFRKNNFWDCHSDRAQLS